MNLDKVSLIKAEEFENERLLAVKKERTLSEYSWTLASSLCWYMMEKIDDGEMITYLDADMCFFDNPKIIFEEIGNSSVAIVEHRLEGRRQILEKFVGKYNVAWVSFKKDKDGVLACEWWKERVLEWCGAYFENGKLGDQHYLNDWLTRFNNVHVIKHEGADVAPWNVDNRKITLKNDKIFIGEVPLVFYHFHNFILINKKHYIPVSAYHIPQSAKKYIYKQYFLQMQEIFNIVNKIDSDFNFGFKRKFIKSFIVSILFSCKFIDNLYIKYSHYNLEKTYK
jgi:hypothetical protein